jgi:hypothetical protein
MITQRLILLLLLAACPAAANTLIVNNVDNAVGLQNSLWINESGTDSLLYFAGGIDITVDGYSRLVYCVDLLTSINVPGTYTTTMDFADTAGLERVEWLMQNYWPAAPMYTGVNLQLQGAAFQLAIWDILTDNGNGFAAGTVQAGSAAHPTNSAVLAAAVLYEAESVGMSSDLGMVYHNQSNGVPVQALMGRPATDGGPSPTPEPASILPMFSGLALVWLSRLRRGRRG